MQFTTPSPGAGIIVLCMGDGILLICLRSPDPTKLYIYIYSGR
jgi:hypothetical protein